MRTTFEIWGGIPIQQVCGCPCTISRTLEGVHDMRTTEFSLVTSRHRNPPNKQPHVQTYTSIVFLLVLEHKETINESLCLPLLLFRYRPLLRFSVRI